MSLITNYILNITANHLFKMLTKKFRTKREGHCVSRGKYAIL